MKLRNVRCGRRLGRKYRLRHSCSDLAKTNPAVAGVVKKRASVFRLIRLLLIALTCGRSSSPRIQRVALPAPAGFFSVCVHAGG